MPSIRVRQAGTGDHTATLTDEGLDAVQTLEERQYRYLLAAYVDRQYAAAGKDLPAAMRNGLRIIARRARYDPKLRGDDGLPKWERGMVLVPKANWRGMLGGVRVLAKNTGKGRPGPGAPECYVPLFVEGKLDPTRPLYLLVPPRVGG